MREINSCHYSVVMLEVQCMLQPLAFTGLSWFRYPSPSRHAPHFLRRCLGIVREATSWRFPSLFSGPPTLDALDDESPLNITVSIGSSVGDEWLDGLDNLHLSRDAIERTGTRMTPPLWDSGRCMEIHGTPKLQTEVDPGGYLIFTEGR